MVEDTKRQLLEWAETYHCAGFIPHDPVQFPHRYLQKQDIEISGLLTAVMSFGNRRQILKKADELHGLMGESPYGYVLARQWEADFPASDRRSFYRMLSYSDFHAYFSRLHKAYSAFESLEDALHAYSGTPMERLCAFLNVSAKSPQKKLNMFLRWMIRKNSEVDFGLWKSFDCKDLIVPLDTHVCRVACALGLTETETFSLRNARRITAALAEVFPDDPCLGDFALFGYGVNNQP
ncbi:TIGR02757 family protein [Bacteroides heparinolyticus]|uniref:TIGR02757 family protein n=1 Tax=Prevotella heparinolytica TaxID=28113 RepID=UPI0035A16E13